MQEKWAALLANASDTEHRVPVLPSYVETLKQLTPEQGAVLDCTYDRITNGGILHPKVRAEGMLIGGMVQLALDIADLCRTAKVDERSLVLLVDDLIRLGLIRSNNPGDATYPFLDPAAKQGLWHPDAKYFLTPFGYEFLSACHPPTGN